MSRRSDRKKHDKENAASAASKDESDAATLRSSDCDLLLRSGRSPIPPPSLLHSRENSTPLQLLSEATVDGGTRVADCKTTILDAVTALEMKINAMLQRQGMSDSSGDKDSVELQTEMENLLKATLKQKEDFNQLYETVRRQKEMLQRLENLANTGSLGKPVVSAVPVNSRDVSPVQCCHDLETRNDHNATVVYLINGRYEYRRTVSHASDALINVHIPDSVNSGSRMLPGRQSFPNKLLQWLESDAPGISPNDYVMGNSSDDVMGNFPDDVMGNSLVFPENFPNARGGSELPGAAGEVKGVTMGSGRSCPVCALVFPLTESIDAFERHVQGHFEEN